MENQDYSNLINERNVSNIRKQISQSRYGKLTTENEVTEIITDFDTFPYPRWYRGEYQSSHPVIAEREAGYRPIENQCYDVQRNKITKTYPNHCFEGPCSTVYPCYPQYLAKLSDREAMNVLLNKSCTIQFR